MRPPRMRALTATQKRGSPGRPSSRLAKCPMGEAASTLTRAPAAGAELLVEVVVDSGVVAVVVAVVEEVLDAVVDDVVVAILVLAAVVLVVLGVSVLKRSTGRFVVLDTGGICRSPSLKAA